MRLLIIGAKGQLGTEMQKQLAMGRSVLGILPMELTHAEINAVDAEQLDIRDEENVRRVLVQMQPDIVIHCAAMTNVDGCEDNAEQAMKVNGKAVKYVAQVCEQIKAKLVFISTDYVFSGTKGIPYSEEDRCDPQSVYGRSKYLGEEYALKYCSRTFVVRTSWLYGLHGHNFVKTILKKGRETDLLKVVNDQFGNPTNAEDLAYHIWKLVITDRYGIYHCTGKGVCSWYEFACAIVKDADLSCQVLPCSSLEYPQKAKRPAYSALSHQALQETVGDQMRPWRDALQDFLSKLNRTEGEE